MGENSFGAEVKKIRKSKGLTVVQLAKKADLSNGMISQIENDKRKIFQDSFLQVLSALNITNASAFFSLIKSSGFMSGWSEDVIKICLEVKEILDYGEKDEKEDVLLAIKRSQKFRDLKKPVAGLSSERRKKHITK